MTAIDLAWHLASSEWMFSRMVLDGAMPGGEGNRPEGIQTPEDILKFYDETVAPVKAELSSATPEQFARVIDFHGMQYSVARGLHDLGVRVAPSATGPRCSGWSSEGPDCRGYRCGSRKGLRRTSLRGGQHEWIRWSH